MTKKSRNGLVRLSDDAQIQEAWAKIEARGGGPLTELEELADKGVSFEKSKIGLHVRDQILKYGTIKLPRRLGRPKHPDLHAKHTRLADVAEAATLMTWELGIDPIEACKVSSERSGEFNWWTIKNAALSKGGKDFNRTIWLPRKRQERKYPLRFKFPCEE